MQALEVDIHMGLYVTAASGAFLLPPAVLFQRKVIWLNFTAATGGCFYGPSGAGGQIDWKSKQAPKNLNGYGRALY